MAVQIAELLGRRILEKRVITSTGRQVSSSGRAVPDSRRIRLPILGDRGEVCETLFVVGSHPPVEHQAHPARNGVVCRGC